MAYFKKKPVVIEAITFDELVQHGIDSGAPLVKGMPWSFNYKGCPITHENDRCYLVLLRKEPHTLHFTPDDMLITEPDGEISVCKRDIFAATYYPHTEPLPHIGY